MIVRALTSSGDWTFGAGLNNYLKNNAAVAQAIATRLLMFLGDCFFATNVGIDWLNQLGGKNQLQLQLSINATILNTENVTGIVNLETSLDPQTRRFTVAYEVSTTFGNVANVVTQTLGVGPLAPPVATPLLPQFNAGLQNNASNIAIPGAMFNPIAWWEVDLEYFIERRTSTGTYTQRGLLVLKYDIDTTTWAVDNFVFDGSSGPTTGVVFSVNASTGQVYYSTDDMTGSNYVGNLVIQSGLTFVAGA